MDLIGAPEVQRLRQVRQLGLASLAYHGAEHSRFIHTIGVCHLAKRLYVASMSNAGRAIDPDELCLVVAAALLHDTGHPPFSHAVEKELGVKHERVTAALVRGDTKVNELLKRHGGDHFVDSVADHIEGATDAPTVDIISSQLDADRLDYVLRDGYYAGVPNAQYDLERVIQMSLRDDDGVFFDQRAQYAIEGYFIARYHLYLQLYYHKTVRAAEAMLRSLLRRATTLAQQGADLGSIAPDLLSLLKTRDAEYSVRISDSDMWSAFGQWRANEDPILSDLSIRILSRNLFRALDVPSDEKDRFYSEYLPKIQSLADKAGFDPNYYVLTDTTKDTPYKLVDFDPTMSVRVVGNDGTMHRLETQSGIIGALRGEAYQNLRCCVPAVLRDQVREILG